MAADPRERLSLLASVRDLDEVGIALDADVGLIDMKEPARGALGAVDAPLIRAAVHRVGNRALTSATIGETPESVNDLSDRVRRVGDCGVDFVKVGLRADDRLAARLTALAACSGDYRLVAVWLADHAVPDEAALVDLAAAGFAGAMLDTEDKARGALPELLHHREMATFVSASRACALLTGLAGSLRIGDIPALAPLGADYLGFRGGLCDGDRSGQLNPARVREAVAQLSASMPVPDRE